MSAEKDISDSEFRYLVARLVSKGPSHSKPRRCVLSVNVAFVLQLNHEWIICVTGKGTTHSRGRFPFVYDDKDEQDERGGGPMEANSQHLCTSCFYFEHRVSISIVYDVQTKKNKTKKLLAFKFSPSLFSLSLSLSLFFKSFRLNERPSVRIVTNKARHASKNCTS